ncbi:MAG: hypothetical protein UU48_C0018G0001, partial [Candidatus Uhrbacteria bacterium GW2011_GWF2_41_16]
QDLPPADISMSGKEQREVEKESYWTREQYIEWAEEFGKNEQWMNETFEFQKDGTTIMEENLYIFSTGIKHLPIGLIEVKGDLNISQNPSLKLDGYPKKVGGKFTCRLSAFSTLEGIPEEIGGSIGLDNNFLVSLVGLPEVVNGAFLLNDNDLVTLKGLSMKIHGDLILSSNASLVSLDALSGVRIDGDLYLYDILATEIPSKIEIKGSIWVRSSQTALALDAKKKGYDVRVQD